MRMRVSLIALGAVSLSWGAGGQSLKEDLAWMGTLGFPNVKELKLKRTAVKEEGVSRRNAFGFYLAEDEEIYQLLSFDFARSSLLKRRFEPLQNATMKDYAEVLLKAVEQVKPWAVRNTMMFGEPFPTRSHFCVVAWIAQQRGEQEVAERLYQEAQKVPAQSDRFATAKPNPKESFREGLEREVAMTMLNQTIRGFGAPFRTPKAALSRAELLKRFELLKGKFAKHPEAPFIVDTIGLLKQMIAEDQKHEKITDEALAKLPIEQQVEEHLYRLREARSEGLSSDGNCYIDSPELGRLGYAAVPRLIEALDDQRFTRGTRERFAAVGDAGTRIVRVGDVVARTLQGITTENFYGGHHMPVVGDRGAKTQEQRRKAIAKAKAWWAKFQEKGEAQILDQGVRQGGREGANKARRLTDRHPDRAFQSIVAGLQKTQKDYQPRLVLLESLARIKTKESTVVFKKEAKGSPHLLCRTFSARTLFYRGERKAAVESMVLSWKERDRWLGVAEIELWNTLPELVEFLLSCDDAAAVHQIIADYDSLNVQVRYALVQQLRAYRGLMGRMVSGKRRAQFGKPFLEAIHELLVIAARDDEIRWALPLMMSPDRRVADAAVQALAKWQPETFANVDESTLLARERARYATLAILRKEDGLGGPVVKPDWLQVAKAKTPNHVTEVEIRGREAGDLPEWLKPLSAMKGKALDVEVLSAALLGYEADRRFGNTTFAISVRRHANGAGVHLLADLQPRLRNMRDWRINTWHSFDSSMAYKDPTRWKKEHRKDMERAQKIFDAPGDKETRMRLMMHRR